MWIVVAVPVMIGVSMLNKTMARRLCLGGAAFFTILLVFVPVIGHEVNGARRWFGMGFAQFQPSEFLKPMFIVSLAWLLSLREKDRSLPVIPLTGLLTAIIAFLLMQQPNFGETIIFVVAWVMLLALSGALDAYSWHARRRRRRAASSPPIFSIRLRPRRIDAFLFGGSGDTDTYQTDSALRTLTGGGLFGTGPGGGTRKFQLPEPHTDYIFSVIGEEFGLIACSPSRSSIWSSSPGC